MIRPSLLPGVSIRLGGGNLPFMDGTNRFTEGGVEPRGKGTEKCKGCGKKISGNKDSCLACKLNTKVER